MSDDTNETHTAALRQSITKEMRKRGLSPVLARSAASLMVAESAQPHEMTDGEPLVAMNGRVFTVDMAVTRWLASDGREFATDASAASAPPAQPSAARPAQSFDLHDFDGAVDAALHVLTASR